MNLYDTEDFLALSRELAYQLDASVGREQATLETMLEGRQTTEVERDILLSVLSYLNRAYGRKRRKLGPKAVLHPLRATALLARTPGEVSILDLLTELLHDKFEDIHAGDFEPQTWAGLEDEFHALLGHLAPETEWFLMERLQHLTRLEDGETYYQYIGRLLTRAAHTPELVKVKLADRLDNTLDVRVDAADRLDDEPFFANLFHLLFSPRHDGFPTERDHPPAARLDTARRLYELFKNTVVLSLVRQHRAVGDDRAAATLFAAIARAGLLEGQRIVTHLFTYHFRDVASQRALVLETMDYCHSGGLESVTKSSTRHRLDGLFLDRFDSPSSDARRAKLQTLGQDKALMSAAGIAFVVIFASFLSDPSYYVRGVTTEGIQPVDEG